MSQASDPPPTSSSLRRSSSAASRLVRLALKESREILRDRRTVVTLVLMPVLIYPLLALVFQKSLLSSSGAREGIQYIIGVASREDGERLMMQVARGEALLKEEQRLDGDPATDSASLASDPPPRWVQADERKMEGYVADGTLDIAILNDPPSDGDPASADVTSPRWKLIHRQGSITSDAALDHLEQRLKAYSDDMLARQLEPLGVDFAEPVDTFRVAVAASNGPVFSLAALVPLILILMTITGAVYPAIDLTAGERERGTLETLIAAPVPRLGLLLAKYTAVLIVALLTALVNLVSMTVTAWATGLDALLLGDSGMSLAVALKILGLLALFAAFFSAVLLAITSYARSFKEAQAYIIPLMLLSLAPGVVCLVPNLALDGLLAIVPLLNIVLLSRDLLEGSVDPMMAAVAIASTAFYIFAALALAARIFGTDAILYGSQATWADLFRRPRTPQQSLSLSAAVSCLALIFPIYFIGSSFLARMTVASETRKLVVSALVTVVCFGVVPWLFVRQNRVEPRTGMRLRWPGTLAIAAAVLLGVTLWPLAFEIHLLNDALGIDAVTAEQFLMVEKLTEAWRDLPLTTILICLGIVPGIFEELIFRGFVFAALRNRMSPAKTIVASSLLFGLFHVIAGNILAPERFLPSTFLGLVLGFVVYRTGSVFPAMLIHSVHNCLVLSMVYYHNDLADLGWDLGLANHLPAAWVLSALVGLCAGFLLIWLAAPKDPVTRASGMV